MCPADVQGRFANRPYGKDIVLGLWVSIEKALVFRERGAPNYFFDTDTDPDPEKKLYAIALGVLPFLHILHGGHYP